MDGSSLRKERARLRASLHDARLRMRFVDAHHPARAILNTEMQEMLERLEALELLISPPRPRPSYNLELVEQVEVSAPPIETVQVEPEPVVVPVAAVQAAPEPVMPEPVMAEQALAEQAMPEQEVLEPAMAVVEAPPEPALMGESIVVRTLQPQAAIIHAPEADKGKPASKPVSKQVSRQVSKQVSSALRSGRAALARFAAATGVVGRDFGRLLGAFGVFLVCETAGLLYALTYPFRLIGELAVRAALALAAGVKRSVPAMSRGAASVGGGAGRYTRAAAGGANRALNVGAGVLASVTGGTASGVRRGFARAGAIAGGAATRSARVAGRGIGWTAVVVQTTSRQVASAGIRHAGVMASHGRRAFDYAAPRVASAARITATTTSRLCFDTLPRTTARVAGQTAIYAGKTSRHAWSRGSEIVRNAVGDFFIRLLVLTAYVAPVVRTVARVVSRLLRLGWKRASDGVAHVARVVVSTARSLPRKSRRLGRAFVARARPVLRRAVEQASALFWNAAFHVCVWLLLLVSHAGPLMKRVDTGARRMLEAGGRYAAIGVARSAVAISAGWAWLRRRSVAAFRLARERGVPALRSGIGRASHAARTVSADVAAKALVLARRLELGRRSAGLLAACRSTWDRLAPIVSDRLVRASRAIGAGIQSASTLLSNEWRRRRSVR